MKRLKRITRYIRHSALLKALILVLILAFAIITQAGCGNKEVSRTEFALNTNCTISIEGMSSSEAGEVMDDAFGLLRNYENLLSTELESSDIYRINEAAGEPVEVSDDTIAVLKQGILMGELSGGKFDITVGRLMDMWDFTGEPRVPSEEEIDEALEAVDYRNIEIDANLVTLEDPGAAIDLGGIAKGYIADRLSEMLEDRGVTSAVINLGGNVELVGAKENGDPWKVGIERPYSDGSDVVGTIEGRDMTVVTSGVYERKFEQDGVLYHHILDPATGYPAETDIESVTVTAKNGNSVLCDAFATICLILGSDGAEDFIAEMRELYPDIELEAAFIDSDDEMMQTDGMDIKAPEQ